MNENLTELVFILDRSGSMSGLESDTIGGFNGLIEKQKKESGEAYVTTILFDHESEVLHDRIAIADVPSMTEKEYYTRGCTALLDAIGSTIKHIAGIHKYARPEDVPAHTLFVITTDGMENASRSYSYAEVRSMIEHEQQKYGWEFLFLGANIDAAAAGERIGIDRRHSVEFTNDAEGIEVNYQALSDCVSDVRCACAGAAPLETGAWKKRIEDNHRKRR